MTQSPKDLYVYIMYTVYKSWMMIVELSNIHVRDGLLANRGARRLNNFRFIFIHKIHIKFIAGNSLKFNFQSYSQTTIARRRRIASKNRRQ